VILTTALTVLTTNSYNLIKKIKSTKRRRKRTRRATGVKVGSKLDPTLAICTEWFTLQMLMNWLLSMTYSTVMQDCCAIRTWIWWRCSSLPIRRIAQTRYTLAFMIHISWLQSIGWETSFSLQELIIHVSVHLVNSSRNQEEMFLCLLIFHQDSCTITHSSWDGIHLTEGHNSILHLCLLKLAKSQHRSHKKLTLLDLKMRKI